MSQGTAFGLGAPIAGFRSAMASGSSPLPPEGRRLRSEESFGRTASTPSQLLLRRLWTSRSAVVGEAQSIGIVGLEAVGKG
jgi:hypothetical protein